ncbi:hypothetical protein [Catenulispora rubra]|uniref:hypothetical protein n=1 Tax=Catenulispora rubra TaxID=280293 RepID=UPI0018922499|nr:hypothetical protein [Catenulispora rubra]
MQIRASILASLLTVSSVLSGTGSPTPVPAAAAVTTCTSLHDLGASDIDTTREITTPVTIPGPQITFPDGATQGPSTWYVIHLHVAVTVQMAGTDSGADIGAATDAQDSAQVVFTPGASGGIDWGATSIAEASQTGHVGSGPVEVRVANYLRTAGVKVGSNPISFKGEAFGGAKIERIHIYDDTCIERIGKSPDQVHLTVPAAISGHTGSSLSIPVILHNDGTGAVKGVTLSVTSVDPGLTLAVGNTLTVAQLDKDWPTKIQLVAHTAGTHTVHIAVSTATRPGLGATDLVVTVTKKPSYALAYGAAGVALVLFVLGFMIYRVPAVRRRR